MDFSKIKKISFILLILFILLFPFWCVKGLCTTDSLDTSSQDVSDSVFSVDGIIISIQSNTFVAGDWTTYFLPLEKGYTYTVNLVASTDQLRTGYCNDYEVGSEIFNTALLDNTVTLTINSDNFSYLYFTFGDVGPGETATYTITRKPNTVMTSTIESLVDNVGIGQIWSIFDISINYIVVVVLFAFGAYIIFRVIRKISRGKEGL